MLGSPSMMWRNPSFLARRLSAEPGSVTANWLRIGSMGLERCIEAVVEGSGWRERYGKLPEGRGLGLACGSYMCGAGLPIYWNHMPQSGVQIKLDRSGGVAVFCGQAEIGHRFAVAQGIAWKEGIDPNAQRETFFAKYTDRRHAALDAWRGRIELPSMSVVASTVSGAAASLQ